MKLISWMLIGMFLILGTGCDLLRILGDVAEDAPRRYVLVQNSFTEAAGEVSVSLSDDRIDWSRGSLITNEAWPTPPDISVDSHKIYVIAYWDKVIAPNLPPTVGTLRLWVSENGEEWDEAENPYGGKHYGPYDGSSINRHSRLSVAYHYGTQTWFVAFRDALSREIMILQYDIRCTGPYGEYGSSCADYRAEQIGEIEKFPGVFTSFAPSLGYVDDQQERQGERKKLVLAYVPEGSHTVRIYRSVDGNKWDPTPPSPGAVATRSGGNVESRGAPYLNSSLQRIFLATTTWSRHTQCEGDPELTDIRVWSSANGLDWSNVRSVICVGSDRPDPNDPFLTTYDPAIAGPESEMVIVFPERQWDPDDGLSATHRIVSAAGDISESIVTHTLHSVGLAHGPSE